MEVSQTSSRRYRSWTIPTGIVVAWLLYLWSFQLPALNSVETSGSAVGTPITGWEAFRALELALYPLAILTNPSILVLFPVILVANIAALFTPVIYLLFREKSSVTCLILWAGVACGLLLPKSITGDVFVGYHLWIVSMSILAILLPFAPEAD